MPALVLAAAVLLAGSLYGRFLEAHRSLWYNSTHDRNAHYLYGLRLATDVRQGKVLRLLDDLNQSRVWPPLHGVLAAGVLLVGGLDYRLAVLPSLAGWVGLVTLGFLVARRAAPRGGNLAGLAAALFILASPAHRAFATDVMLESLGACLSLLVLYCYLVAAQARPGAAWTGRCLGLALTALFLHKYNYWALLVLTLLASEALARPRFFRQLLREALAGFGRRAWARSQLRHPLTYVLALTLLLAGGIFLRGDRPLALGGKNVSLYPPHNFIHAAYVVLFLRLFSWWRSHGRAWAGRLDGRARQVVLWHLCPLAVWFLLPKHPSYFLWYLSLANADPTQRFDVLAGVRHYSRWAVEDHHPDLGTALLAAGLCLAALPAWRRLRPGGQAALLLFLIAGVLTVVHPNRKCRCLHSWLAAGWVSAGVGLAALLHGRLTAIRPHIRAWLAVPALAGLGWVTWPALLGEGHALEGGPHPQHHCVLDLTDYCLPELGAARRATVLAAVPVKSLVQWTCLERFGRLDRLEENWYGFGAAGPENRQGFSRWLQTTDCDTLIFFERTPVPACWEDVPECALHAELRELLLAQRVFRLAKQRDFPRHGCRVLVWRR
jgi:hypothetical protein